MVIVVAITFFVRHLWPYFSPVEATVALRFFEAVALRSDELYAGNNISGLRRWPTSDRQQIYSVRVSSVGGEDRSEIVMSRLSEVGSWIGMRFKIVGVNQIADITFRYVNLEDMLGPISPKGLLCLTSAHSRAGLLQTGLAITISHENDFCLDHEILHAIGLSGHWEGKYARSALGTRWANRSNKFSKWDELAVRTLYDQRLKPGASGKEALAIAKDIIAELVLK